MTLIEGIGDEVIQFFIGLFFILIAWCTTNTSNDGSLRTVFLLERRRLRAVRRLITHTESSTIVEGTSVDNSEINQSNSTMEEEKPTSTSADDENQTLQGEETRIVEAMDAPNSIETNGLRRRVNLNLNSDLSNNLTSDGDNSINTSQNDTTKAPSECLEPNIQASSSKNEEDKKGSEKICVKLKFVTDELRVVDGSLKENIGDFKRRHFQIELASNKVVKLIFNGQILQRDSDTLQTCGLFDNCVVHCVFLPGTNSSPGTTSGNRNNSLVHFGDNPNLNNNNQPNEWHLENYLFAILCCFLGAAWYLRYVYSHLYTVTATIGLILMTGIFTIIMFGMHFPENAELNQQRTENIETHQ
ncbi:transmembrane and ubiquitin-like domain-containing protein 1 isoform X2 [Harmonia axyridis]|uniref:transmembrane and ubiquitin-like domain-containing protein 1 isoform X2 n=1 Tax=Harmonia axyridis TaxID=115357 RepID=UPI001E275085|nr:transmembrane and ubiquitin-like domain-containing protein 1 isoform X2 [Harmonia axyridis]